MVEKITNALGPYAKAIVLVVALLAALGAEAIGLDVGLDSSTILQALAATVLVYLTPNKDPDA